MSVEGPTTQIQAFLVLYLWTKSSSLAISQTSKTKILEAFYKQIFQSPREDKLVEKNNTNTAGSQIIVLVLVKMTQARVIWELQL